MAFAIISHEQTQSNRVSCFLTLDAVFPKDPFSDNFRKISCIFGKQNNTVFDLGEQDTILSDKKPFYFKGTREQ